MNFIPKKSFHFPGGQGHEIYEHEKPGLCWQDFFLTLCPKILSLYDIYSAPTLPFSKFRGFAPWKNIQRHWGCNQRKVWRFSKQSLWETAKG
jgi:hypothetical protein